jgi:UDP-N-acetylglucosamine diphosphorylase/glucosamine-1-phosphate N-acetyltransferase
MRVCLFEDQPSFLGPLTLTRPVFDLLCGQNSLADKLLRHFAPCTAGVLVRPFLEDLYRAQHPGVPVNDLAWVGNGPTLFVNGRWLPPAAPPDDLQCPCVGLVDDVPAFVFVGREHLAGFAPDRVDETLSRWKNSLPDRPAGGALIRYPWDLVARNAEQLCRDYDERGLHLRAWHPESLTVVGPAARLLVSATARIDPFVVADTTQGPVVIDRDAVITAFTRLEGPCYIGPSTHVLGAKIRTGTTVGPHCRVGGEVEASIIHGYSNKYHDGFLGHSYIGEWVNLAAGTQVSDLRNDYGPVKVWIDGQLVSTGQTKVGCFLGDHTKTGLGTLINTGTNAGIFCNLLPSGRFVPKQVPSFANWSQEWLTDNGEWTSLMQTARKVMSRRGGTLTPEHEAVYRFAFEATVEERRRALGKAEPPMRRAA